MELTVLGKYGPYPAQGGACSGYLLEEGGTRILIDCGNGVLSRLQQKCSLQDIDCIILSHLHHDHISDMFILRYALDILTNRGLYGKGPLPVYLPECPGEISRQLSGAKCFMPETIREDSEISLNGLHIKFKEMTHPVQSFAISVDNGNKRFVYTGDTSYNSDIAAFAQGADMLLADAGLLEKDKVPGKAPHMSADEVGSIGKQASVRRLILSHIWPGYNEHDLITEASRHFSGAEMAEEMRTYHI